ncbi:MAG: hypothetical protein K5768_03475 [Firmicutes bacterium]|nr:hypothetical protein [Bacillota bacterium]
MGGGRDNGGAAIYKRVNGRYIRVGAYKDKEREANKLIKDFVSNYRNEDVIKDYLDAINKRDRKAVIGLDKYHLRSSDYDSATEKANKEKLRKVRKTLLEIAKDSPEQITKIKENTEKKLQQRVEDNRKKINSLPPDVLAKIEHDIGNMNIGHYVIGYYADTLRTLANTLGISISGRYLDDVNGELEIALGRRLWRGKFSPGKFK